MYFCQNYKNMVGMKKKMVDFKNEIKRLLQGKLKNMPSLEVPPRADLGDYALPCFTLAKELRKVPQQIAKDLAESIKPNKLIIKAIAVGPYVNFFINKEALADNVITQIIKEKDKHGKEKPHGKTVAIDLSSPNIAKPFGVGHLRSTVIGNAIANLYSATGYKSVKINHIGDWGTQFGKLITAYKRWGKEKDLKKEPIKALLSLYVRFHKKNNEKLETEARAWFKELETGNREALRLWKQFKNLSLKEFNKIYKELNIKFDSIEGEAFYNDKMEPIAKMLEERKLLEEDQGAKIVRLEDLPPALIKKSDSTTLYITRDLAAIMHREKKYKPAQLIYVVGSEQTLHFKQLFRIAEMLGMKTKAVHVPFGLFFLPEGKMATREGKVIFLEDVINETVRLAKETIEEKNPKLKNKDKIAKEVAIGAIIFWDLSHDRVRDVLFDIKKVLDFEGETGPYVQYTHARANSILAKAKKRAKADHAKMVTPEEHKVLTLLAEYKPAIEDSARQYKPSILAKYLLTLAQAFNEFYHARNCLKEPDAGLRNARLELVAATAQVLKNGLAILGITAPKEM